MSAGIVKDARGVPIEPGDTLVYASQGAWASRGVATVDRVVGKSRVYLRDVRPIEGPHKSRQDRRAYVDSRLAVVVTLPEVPAA